MTSKEPRGPWLEPRGGTIKEGRGQMSNTPAGEGSLRRIAATGFQARMPCGLCNATRLNGDPVLEEERPKTWDSYRGSGTRRCWSVGGRRSCGREEARGIWVSQGRMVCADASKKAMRERRRIAKLRAAKQDTNVEARAQRASRNEASTSVVGTGNQLTGRSRREAEDGQNGGREV